MKRKYYISQCLSCNRIQSKDGSWQYIEEQTPEMIITQVLCPNCSKTKQNQGQLAENLTSEIVDILVKTPGVEFDCIRALTPLQLVKYKTIVKGTILLYLQQEDR